MRKFADFGMSVQNGLGTAHTGPAKLRAAENDAVLASSHIRPRPSYMALQAHRAPGPRFRQSSRFLPCSPGPCALPDYSPSTARVHEDHDEASRPPFCGTQLAEICGVDRPRYEGDRGAPRLSAPYNYAQLGPPGLEGITPPRRRGAPGGKTSQSEAYSAQLRTFIVESARSHVEVNYSIAVCEYECSVS